MGLKEMGYTISDDMCPNSIEGVGLNQNHEMRVDEWE
jgi:hypothetical protein